MNWRKKKKVRSLNGAKGCSPPQVLEKAGGRAVIFLSTASPSPLQFHLKYEMIFLFAFDWIGWTLLFVSTNIWGLLEWLILPYLRSVDLASTGWERRSFWRWEEVLWEKLFGCSVKRQEKTRDFEKTKYTPFKTKMKKNPVVFRFFSFFEFN